MPIRTDDVELIIVAPNSSQQPPANPDTRQVSFEYWPSADDSDEENTDQQRRRFARQRYRRHMLETHFPLPHFDRRERLLAATRIPNYPLALFATEELYRSIIRYLMQGRHIYFSRQMYAAPLHHDFLLFPQDIDDELRGLTLEQVNTLEVLYHDGLRGNHLRTLQNALAPMAYTPQHHQVLVHLIRDRHMNALDATLSLNTLNAHEVSDELDPAISLGRR